MTQLPPPQARTPAAGAPLPEYVPPYFRLPDEPGIDLIEYARVLWNARGIIAAITATAVILSVLWAFSMTPIYRAETLLSPVQQSKGDGLSALVTQLGDLAALAEAYVGGGKDRTAESIATLKSRALTTHFIQQHNLKPVLFAERWDADAKAWRPSAKVPSDYEASERFDRDIRHVHVDRRTGMVTLSVDWKDPTVAAQWANALVAEVNARRRNEAIAEARTSIEYLKRELAKNSTIEIQQAVYRLIEAQTKTMTVANTRAEYAFRVVDPAVPPEVRIRPRRTLMVMIGLFVGVLVAVLFVLARDGYRRRGVGRPT